MALPDSYWDIVRPTYIENWPPELCRLSIAQVDVPLTLAEAEAIGASMCELYEMFPKPHMRDLTGIRKRVDEAVKKFPRGAFIRLGSRSPKDSAIAMHRSFRCRNGKEALEVILGVSERMMEDLLLALEMKYPPHVFLREWIDIPKWCEFRCFMRDRELVGVSQYHYFEWCPQAGKNRDGIRWAIDQFFPSFKEASHLDTVIFDVVVKHHGYIHPHERVRVSEWSVKLLEINPFFEHTDPCLFDWRHGGDFDRTFRYLDEGKKTIKVQ